MIPDVNQEVILTGFNWNTSNVPVMIRPSSNRFDVAPEIGPIHPNQDAPGERFCF
jgi:hypothetical protein